MYLNDVFAVNKGSNSRKLKILVQHKCNFKYGCNGVQNQGSSLRNRVDNNFKLTANVN